MLFERGIIHMQFVKERLGKWIQAAIVLVVGILCIVAGAAMGGNSWEAAQNALDGISVTLGVILIVVGGLSLILSIVVAILAKKGFAAVAIPSAIILAFGISLVVAKYAASLLLILLTVIPYLLIAIGAVILGDAIFNLVTAIIKKNVKGALVGVIIAMIIGVVAIVLGALCIGNDPVIAQSAQLIVFGIIVCLVALLLVVLTFVKLPDAVVVVVKKDQADDKKEEK